MKKDTNHQKSWIDYFAVNYFNKLIRFKHKTESSPDSFHLLDDKEIEAIKKIKFWAMFKAAACGIFGVIFLYLPYYFFPYLFPDTFVELPWFGLTPLPLVFTVYGMLLIIPELYALTVINLQAVYKIAKVCGFPNQNDPDYEKHLKGLYHIGTEQQSKEMSAYGINPFEGWSKSFLVMVIWSNRLKGAVTNVVTKFFLSRVLGRILLRYFIDMIGIVVYAFWNARATYIVIREAKVRIMAPFLIEELTEDLYEDFQADEGFRDFLHNILQLIAVVKRKYHHNHYLLVEKLIKQFDLDYQHITVLPREKIIEQAQKLKPQTQEGVAKLLIFGMLIDGHMSKKEKKVLEQIQQTYPLNYTWKDLKKWETSFYTGQGLDELFAAKILNCEENQEVKL